jgi:hypothetical protein
MGGESTDMLYMLVLNVSHTAALSLSDSSGAHLSSRLNLIQVCKAKVLAKVRPAVVLRRQVFTLTSNHRPELARIELHQVIDMAGSAPRQ